MTEQKFKYYFNGEGFKNKRTLGRAIVESQLSDFGKQRLEELVSNAAKNVSDSQGLTFEEAYKRIHVGFKSNDIRQPFTGIDEVAEQTKGDNFIYLIAYIFVQGGAIVTLESEKVTTKLTTATELSTTALPVEAEDIDPNAPEYNPQETEGYGGMGKVSDDFRVRD